ncbi:MULTISPECIES: hypothetical protein [Pseudobacillus]|uniref:hypothetical protein n=1 Tax=Pseudobacillus TaxID=108525 RepID=UPI00387A3B4F
MSKYPYFSHGFHFRKNKYLSIRPELRALNKVLKKAADEVDVAYVEELMEEKRRLIESV